MTRLPSLVIMGAPKCGTTSLARWLGARYDIVVPKAKELRFLDKSWEHGIAWYLQEFGSVPDGAFTVEATPIYLAQGSQFRQVSVSCAQPESPRPEHGHVEAHASHAALPSVSVTGRQRH